MCCPFSNHNEQSVLKRTACPVIITTDPLSEEAVQSVQPVHTHHTINFPDIILFIISYDVKQMVSDNLHK